MDQELDLMRQAQAAREAEARFRERAVGIVRRVGAVASQIRSVLDQTRPDEQGLFDALGAVRDELLAALATEGIEVFGNPGDPVSDPGRFDVKRRTDKVTERCEVVEVEIEGLLWEDEVIRRAAVQVSSIRSPATGE
ncbi:MAG: hypothetical protein JNG89_03160 [Planctomycetaceae bacterium]|nr:hypothetical protein [Planctomycetaceae bacterium]